MSFQMERNPKKMERNPKTFFTYVMMFLYDNYGFYMKEQVSHESSFD